MARTFAILCLVASCLSAVTVEAEIASQKWLLEQKDIWDLFWRPYQPELTELRTDGRNFNISENLECYKDQKAVQEFLHIHQKNLLPRGEVFSVVYPPHQKLVVTLFKFLYSFKTFECLYKTVDWARFNVNEGLLNYAFSVVVFHHPETRDKQIVPHDEVYPYIYFNDKVIRSAEDAYATSSLSPKSSEHEIIISTNHVPSFERTNHWLAYYIDDVAVNRMHYYAHLAHPFWLSTKECPDIRESQGDRFFFTLDLQWKRYVMECLSNGMEEVEEFFWDQPLPYGYVPDSSDHTGQSLPHRCDNADIPSYNYKLLKDHFSWGLAIKESINSGYVIAPNGTLIPIRSNEGRKILGNLIENNKYSINPVMYGSYERAGRELIASSSQLCDKYTVLPSTLQTYGIDMRDPMYWPLMKTIANFHYDFAATLPKYTNEQLACGGVNITSVVVEDVKTYFTHCDYLISGAVKLHSRNHTIPIKARQECMAHKQPSITIFVNSTEEMTVEMRSFIGPQNDSNSQVIEIDEIHKSYMAMDMWTVKLKPGLNKIERSTFTSFYTLHDQVTGDIDYEKLLNAIAGNGTYEIPEIRYGYPERMAIPKGNSDGFGMKYIIFCTPYDSENVNHFESTLIGHKEFQNHPLGFPLDRPVQEHFFDLPNAYSTNFDIYHVEESEINLTTN